MVHRLFQKTKMIATQKVQLHKFQCWYKWGLNGVGIFCAQAVEGLLDATSGADADLLLRYRECHLLVLKALQDGRAYGPQWCNKQITR